MLNWSNDKLILVSMILILIISVIVLFIMAFWTGDTKIVAEISLATFSFVSGCYVGKEILGGK